MKKQKTLVTYNKQRKNIIIYGTKRLIEYNKIINARQLPCIFEQYTVKIVSQKKDGRMKNYKILSKDMYYENLKEKQKKYCKIIIIYLVTKNLKYI